jgi:hypothetical protein
VTVTPPESVWAAPVIATPLVYAPPSFFHLKVSGVPVPSTTMVKVLFVVPLYVPPAVALLSPLPVNTTELRVDGSA